MAQYFVDPQKQDYTSTTPGWTAKIVPNGSFSRSNSVLNLVSAGAGTHVWGFDPVDGVQDNIEILAKFRFSSDVGKQGIASLRYSGSSEATTKGYTLSASFISGSGQLAVDEGSTGYLFWTPWNYVANTTYIARFRIDGNRIRAKVWTDGSSEPGWMLDFTNDTTSTGAYNGVHSYGVGTTSYDFISFGTNGEVAPISNPVYAIPSSTPTVGYGGGYGAAGSFSGYGISKLSGYVTLDKTQSGNARIQRQIDATQSGISRITKQIPVPQIGTARIQNSATQSQTANARLQRSEPKDQTGNARIARQELRTQYAIARIQASATRTQPGSAMTSIITTKNQPGIARIAELGTVVLQTGIARITAQTPRTQPANARIQKSVTKTTAGNARIQKSVTKTQPATANIRKDTPQNQPGNAAILQGVLRDQTAVARILRIMSSTQPANARIQKSVTQSVIGNARIRIFVLRNQLANSAILRIPQQHQPARGLIAKEMLVAQPGGAFIIRVNEYQNPPRIGIRPQIGGRPGTINSGPRNTIDSSVSRTGRVAERPRTSIVNTRPRASQ